MPPPAGSAAHDHPVPLRATRARVDLDRITANFRAIRAALPGTAVFPVVKANAYGHGAPAVALALERAGADSLCVALLEEGFELRRAGIGIPILVVGALTPAQIGAAVSERLIPAVYSVETLEAVEAAGSRAGRNAPYHLKLDTGMTRLGLPAAEMPALIDRIEAGSGAELAGIFSSLAAADRPDDPQTRRQLAAFAEAVAVCERRGHAPGVRHLANSAAAEGIPHARWDAVRPGLLIYGIAPIEGRPLIPVRPALSLVTEIVQVRDVPAGTAVGYGGSWIAPGPRRLALIPAGYDDGLIRSLSNSGHGLVRGVRAPIVGRISMDLAVLDVTDAGAVPAGETVVLLGTSGDLEITAWSIARAAGTIPWEICSRIGGRVPRDYYSGGRRVGRWSRWSGPVSLAEETLV